MVSECINTRCYSALSTDILHSKEYNSLHSEDFLALPWVHDKSVCYNSLVQTRPPHSSSMERCNIPQTGMYSAWQDASAILVFDGSALLFWWVDLSAPENQLFPGELLSTTNLDVLLLVTKEHWQNIIIGAPEFLTDPGAANSTWSESSDKELEPWI